MIGNDWRMTFAEESEGELSHYGKKGMKWGVRKAVKAEAKAAKRTAKAESRAKQGPPSKTDYYLTGRMGSKDAFKDPAAREQRIAAGKSRTIAAIAAAGTIGLSALGKGGSAPAFVLAGTAAVAGSLASIGAYKAIDLEKASRANG